MSTRGVVGWDKQAKQQRSTIKQLQSRDATEPRYVPPIMPCRLSAHGARDHYHSYGYQFHSGDATSAKFAIPHADIHQRDDVTLRHSKLPVSQQRRDNSNWPFWPRYDPRCNMWISSKRKMWRYVTARYPSRNRDATMVIGPSGLSTIHFATCGYPASEGCDATSQQISYLVTKSQNGSAHGLDANLE